ncbi:hypothetical protein P8452_43252 [Trifolium repens]|nr:hypothetical protein P8452_43252 [Trifolium repens]
MYNSELGIELLTKVKANMMKMFDWYASAHSNQNRNRPYSSGLSMIRGTVSAEQPAVARPQNHYTQEDLDALEKVVRELCESLTPTSFGAAPVPSATSPAVDPFAAGPSHSRPFGRD